MEIEEIRKEVHSLLDSIKIEGESKMNIKTYHREFLDAISEKRLYPWIKIDNRFFYDRKEFIEDLSVRIKNSKKFYIGLLNNIPDIDMKKIDTKSIRLPFPITLFEFRAENNQDDHNIRSLVVLREDEDQNIEMSFFMSATKNGCPQQYIYVPWIFTIRIDELGPTIDAEEEIEFQIAYRNAINFLEQHLSKLEKRVAEIETQMKDNPKKGEMFKEFLIRKKFLETEKKYLEDTDPGSDFGEIITAMSDKIISLLSILNCSNVERIKHHAPEKLNKARVKRHRNPEDSVFTVTIDRSRTQNLFDPGEEGTAFNQGVRLHWRRGHIKRRKTGNYFWSPHLVGRKDLGEIEKDYVVDLSET